MYLKFKMGITEDISQDGLIVCVLLGLFALIGLADNLLVFRTLFRFPRARIGLFALAGGLAIADLLYLALGVPIGILYQFKKFEWLKESPYCKLEGYLSHSFGYITSYHLVGFAVLRAIVLCSRSRRGPTFKQGLCGSLILWVLALIANIPMFTAFDDFEDEPLCVIRFDYIMEEFMFLTIGFSFVIPLVVIVLIYFATYFLCRRFCEDSYSAHQIQFSRLVTTVICIYVICWLPVNVLHVVIFFKSKTVNDLESELSDAELDRLDYDVDKLYVVRDYFIGIAHLDKFIRPIIYATKSKDFSKSFDEVINCKQCFKDEESGGNSSSTAPLAGPNENPPCEENL